MIKRVTTSSGFSCDVEENAFDDMEVVDLLAEVSNDNFLAYASLIKRILSPKDKQRLYDHVRCEDGRVPIEQCGKEFGEIMEALSSVKK